VWKALDFLVSILGKTGDLAGFFTANPLLSVPLAVALLLLNQRIRGLVQAHPKVSWPLGIILAVCLGSGIYPQVAKWHVWRKGLPAPIATPTYDRQNCAGFSPTNALQSPNPDKILLGCAGGASTVTFGLEAKVAFKYRSTRGLFLRKGDPLAEAAVGASFSAEAGHANFFARHSLNGTKLIVKGEYQHAGTSKMMDSEIETSLELSQLLPGLKLKVTEELYFSQDEVKLKFTYFDPGKNRLIAEGTAQFHHPQDLQPIAAHPAMRLANDSWEAAITIYGQSWFTGEPTSTWFSIP
jgi:hypothetical protein